MSTTTFRGLYVRRSNQVARTAGFCIICETPIMAGEVMAILAYGGKGNDWGRAHPLCADRSPDVLNTETVQLISDAAERDQIDDDPDIPAIDFIELQKGQYQGSNKYAVRLDGKIVWNTPDRRRAEGAVAFYQALNS